MLVVWRIEPGSLTVEREKSVPQKGKDEEMLLGVGAGGRDVCEQVDSRSERKELRFGV